MYPCNNTAEICLQQIMHNFVENMSYIFDSIHRANPDAKIVGFGYDLMFGGIGCRKLARSLFPQCFRKEHTEVNRCVNSFLVALTEVTAKLAKVVIM